MLKVSKKLLPLFMSLSLMFPHIMHAGRGSENICLGLSIASMITSLATLFVTLKVVTIAREEFAQTKQVATSALLGTACHQRALLETVRSMTKFELLSPTKSIIEAAEALDKNIGSAHACIKPGMDILCEEFKQPAYSANTAKFVSQLKKDLYTKL